MDQAKELHTYTMKQLKALTLSELTVLCQKNKIDHPELKGYSRKNKPELVGSLHTLINRLKDPATPGTSSIGSKSVSRKKESASSSSSSSKRRQKKETLTAAAARPKVREHDFRNTLTVLMTVTRSRKERGHLPDITYSSVTSPDAMAGQRTY